MSIAEFAAGTGRVVLALLAVFLVSFVGRVVSRRLRQPTVVAEIALGLAIGPILISLGSRQTLLPTETVGWLRYVGHVGLVLFLIGVAHELRRTKVPPAAS